MTDQQPVPQHGSNTDAPDGFAVDGPIVAAEWLISHLGSPAVRVLDVRPQAEYLAGHVPGAIWSRLATIHLSSSDDDAIVAFTAAVGAELQRVGLENGERVIVYEAFSGTMAARAVWALDYAGHRTSAMLDGGLIAWQALGGALVADTVSVEPSQLAIQPDRSVLTGAGELIDSIGGGEPLRPLDTRSRREFALGTIPGSVHIEWLEHLDEHGYFLPADDLRRRYAEAGVLAAGSDTVVTFCGSGYRAAHTYVLLKALGYPQVANYAPSWSEWATRDDTEVERPNI